MATKRTRRVEGTCGCGAVQFTVNAPLKDVVWCHCSRCQRFHGGPGPYTAAPRASVRFTEQRGLTWWQVNAHVRRGFCSTCGSSLFWNDETDTNLAICAGALVSPTGIKSKLHIYAGSKPDWYVIKDGLPKKRAL